jgi:antitoxin component YwqK of YwqJK toxin-antitoxin module
VEVVKNINIAMERIFRLISIFITIYIISSSCSSSYKPEDVFQNNDTLYLLETKKPFSGYIRTFYENGKLKSVKEYKNGFPDGYYLRFYPNGKMSLKMEYLNGKPLYFIQYYENSKIKAKQFDSAGYRWIFRYFENGKVLRKESLKNGLLNGIIFQYHENGNVEMKITYKDGKRNGSFKMYFPNGKLKAECNYVNDSIDGVFKIWTEDGYYGEETFKNGKRYGVWKYYYPSGKIKTEVFISDIGTVKERIEYDENGKIIDKFTSNIDYYD